ncbi:nitrate- and nitrite sensing domain-containing protein [Phytohabitans sp. ZYX-F-186]|uniref:histidine kinase n=1 Tax=Phytohabitans maris TaxID=3071409 RepID=A0ABU0ZEW2_9ACTN|nr:nitrate- and nitrite sensing domain-containing protein [Phytohabitans sp. ZYX-F-186]MDQ7905578.1 nitrate- and nitrite sensing domain-containing protein [Phytohabitans sp. ZYX-F-186]
MRIKVFALLLSLAALWAFAAFVTTRDGLNLLWVSTLDQKYGRPTDSLILALQQERRLSVVYLGSGPRAQRTELDAQRARTDEARAKLSELAGDTDVRLAASEAAEQRIDELFDELQELDSAREAINTSRIGRDGASSAFTGMIDASFRVFGSLAGLDDQEIAKDGRTLVQLTRAREVISQEDALVSGALAAGRMTESERARLVQLSGTQRFLRTEAVPELHPDDATRYNDLINSAAMRQFTTYEDRLMGETGGGRPPVNAVAWRGAVDPLLSSFTEMVEAGVDDTVERATPAAVGVVVRLGLAGGLGLVALIASIIMSITTARALVRQLERLRNAAWDLANARLPSVVERLRQGEKVDVVAEAPPLTFGNDEIGQVGQAINAVQETAIRAAVDQAELRNGVRDLFLGLARRNQALVHRQLKVLDEIERRETDAHELADLFKVDHLATRMRRNAENLIVLSGAVPGRRWRNPVPFVDVVRGAVAEVEDYTRVSVLPIDVASLSGRAVSDVIHLLAELIENAASFSPPYTMVNVGGQKVANGFVVEIEDRGLGMSEQELDAANDLVSNPPEFNLSSTARLGLYVVGRLAERHGIDVRLRRSPYGGTMAIVLIPSTLVVSDKSEEEEAPESAEEAAPEVEVPAEERRRVRAYQSLRSTSDSVPDAPVTAPPAPPTAIAPQPEAPVSPAPIIARARVTPPPPERRGDNELPSAGRPPATAATDGAATNGSGHAEPPRDAVTLTPSGLPWRVRQASLAAPLRQTPPAPEAQPPASTPRTPEQTRSMMSSYQSATRRGRAEAERQLNAETPPPPAEPDRSASTGDTEPTA